jgi:hypothetical protein
VSFAAITLCIASQRVFIVVGVYFFINSVRKLLDTPSYNRFETNRRIQASIFVDDELCAMKTGVRVVV